MQNNPKVSVVVPIYKVEKFLPRCIESLLAQTLRDIEIILVDDGSPDGSPALCDAYAAKDSRIRVIHKANGGLFRARHTGIEAATAKYIGAVDGDDFVAPDMFETLLREAENHDAQMVCCSLVHYWDDGRQIPCKDEEALTGFYEGERLQALIQDHLFIGKYNECPHIIPSLCAKIIDRSLLMEVYRDLDPSCFSITIGEDMLMSYSCMLRAQRVSVLGNFYPYFYVQHQASMIQSYNRNRLNAVENLLRNLYRMHCSEDVLGDIHALIQRYGSSMALNIARGIAPPDSSLLRRMRETTAVVRHMHSDPLWKRTLCPDGAKVFPYKFERTAYWAFIHRMPRTMLLMEILHRCLRNLRKG